MANEMDELFRAWDEVDGAAARVETSLPHQMSKAIGELELARKNMRSVLQSFAMSPAGRAAFDSPGKENHR